MIIRRGTRHLASPALGDQSDTSNLVPRVSLLLSLERALGMSLVSIMYNLVPRVFSGIFKITARHFERRRRSRERDCVMMCVLIIPDDDEIARIETTEV